MELPIVIVGGGTAGSTVAAQLAPLTQRHIIVCEPGDTSRHDDHSRFFDVVADDALISRESVDLSSTCVTDSYLQARAIGGGSAVNGMLLSGDEPPHLRGLTRLATEKDMGQVARALLEAGGRACRLWWNGGRWNPGRALMHLVDEGRVELRHHEVTRVLHDDGVVTGVMCNGEVISTDCVVLTAGALASPRLLLTSGFDALNTTIGEGVQDHPCLTFTMALKTHQVSRFDACVVLDVDLDDGFSGLIVGYERASSDDEEHGLLSALLMNPRSRGRIDPATGKTQFNVLDDGNDARAMTQLVRRCISLLSAGPVHDIASDTWGDAHGTTLGTLMEMGDRELETWIRRSVAPVSHVASSLHLSVDENGFLKGAIGVVVADASVLPGVPHETPAAPVTMEALRIARTLGGLLK